MPIIKGNANNSILVGSSADDDIYGYDVLIGSGGDDYLNGGIGEDTMDGGTGNDIYVVDDFDDKVVEHGNSGNDTVSASISYNLNWANFVENLVLSGSPTSTATAASSATIFTAIRATTISTASPATTSSKAAAATTISMAALAPIPCWAGSATTTT